MAGSNFSHPWKYFMYKLCNCLPWEYTEILLGILWCGDCRSKSTAIPPCKNSLAESIALFCSQKFIEVTGLIAAWVCESLAWLPRLLLSAVAVPDTALCDGASWRSMAAPHRSAPVERRARNRLEHTWSLAQRAAPCLWMRWLSVWQSLAHNLSTDSCS